MEVEAEDADKAEAEHSQEESDSTEFQISYSLGTPKLVRKFYISQQCGSLVSPLAKTLLKLMHTITLVL